VSLQLIEPRLDADWREARRLIEEYAVSLRLDLSFQGIAHELAHLAEEYGPPAGAFLLAQEQGQNLGCVGLRALASGAGEIKRLYTVPAARGRGVGRLLALAIVARGRELGYERLLLDTLPSMQQAQRLYITLGFAPTSAYRFNPVPGTVFMELMLRD
jgi:putative acetyltransferase